VRSDDRVADFVDLTWDELQRLRGFGSKKIERLVVILAGAMPADFSVQTESTIAAPALDTQLAALGIPENFPVACGRFSARSVEFAATQGCPGIGGLLRLLQTHGEAGLLKFQNLGRKSVGEVAEVYAAIMQGDEVAVASRLPYRAGCAGLHLAEAIAFPQ
jgi:DNA-directed RNA polymerase alpha subunit